MSTPWWVSGSMAGPVPIDVQKQVPPGLGAVDGHHQRGLGGTVRAGRPAVACMQHAVEHSHRRDVAGPQAEQREGTLINAAPGRFVG